MNMPLESYDQTSATQLSSQIPLSTHFAEQSSISTSILESKFQESTESTHLQKEPISTSISYQYAWKTSIVESTQKPIILSTEERLPASSDTTLVTREPGTSAVVGYAVGATVASLILLIAIIFIAIIVLVRRRRRWLDLRCVCPQISISFRGALLRPTIADYDTAEPFTKSLLLCKLVSLQNDDLHKAAGEGNLQLLKHQRILDANTTNSSNETLLHLAAANGHFQIVEFLLERGAKPNLRNSKGQTALMTAAWTDHTDVVSILCRKCDQTDVNLFDYNGRTALHETPYKTSKYLLGLGDRIQVDAVDCDGNTPLHLAVSKVNDFHSEEHRLQKKFLISLLKRGVDVNSRNWKGRTPLVEASIRDNYQIVSVLLNPMYKTDINMKDNAGKTALIHAVEKANFKTIELLLAAGANVNCYDLRGFTALHAAFYSEEMLMSNLWQKLIYKKRIFIKSKWVEEQRKFIESILLQNKKLMKYLFKKRNCNLQHRDFRSRSALEFEQRIERTNVALRSNNMQRIIHSLTDDRGNTILHWLCLTGENIASTLSVLSDFIDDSSVSQEILNFKNDRERTALHHVAMRSNNRISLDNAKALIKAGADRKIRDIHGRIPAEYSESKSLYELLVDKDDSEIMMNSKEVLKCCLEIETVSGFEIIQRLLQWNQRQFLSASRKKNLLKSLVPNSYSSNVAYSIWQNGDFAYRNAELFNVCDEVTKFVEKLLRFVTEKEPRFESRFMLVGSARENTKIKDPDEFDFDVIFEKLNHCCQIVQTSFAPKGFVHLKKKSCNGNRCSICSFQNHSNLTFNDFFSEDGFLMTDEINARFQVCIQQVLEDRMFWETENTFDLLEDHHFSEERTFPIPPRVCATLKLRLNQKIGSHNTFKRISVDIVPCIHIDNWWPNNTIYYKNFEALRNGWNLVFDQPQRKYPWVPYSAPYARISFAPLESEIIAESPPIARAAYMVAKQLLQKPKHSYILKTCLLYCLEALQVSSSSKSRFEDVRESELNFWVRKLLKCYLLFCLQDFVPCYFMPEFHLPFTDYAKSNHELLKILGVNCDNGLEILQQMMESRNSSKANEGYCAKICNVIDGILDVYRVYWSVCGEETEVEFCLPNPESDNKAFGRTEFLDNIRSNVPEQSRKFDAMDSIFEYDYYSV